LELLARIGTLSPNDINRTRPGDPKQQPGVGVNIGVAMVVPSYKILEIVDSETTRKERAELIVKKKGGRCHD
jgi:hypothetical protein